MALKDVTNKIKQWDNRAAQWMSRHFYIILFEVILMILFILAFINSLKIIDSSFNVHKESTVERLLLAQSINTSLIVMLLLLIALGILNIINSNSRLRIILKNIEFSLSKRRVDHKPQDD